MPTLLFSSDRLAYYRRALRSTNHSLGGITLTIPDLIPYLSIFCMNDLKLRN